MQVVPGLHLPRFTLEQYKSAYCDVITNTGQHLMHYSRLRIINTDTTYIPLQENIAA